MSMQTSREESLLEHDFDAKHDSKRSSFSSSYDPYDDQYYTDDDTDSLVGVDSLMSPSDLLEDIPFPPMFFFPGYLVSFFIIVVITGSVLAITVFSEQIERYTGLDQDTLIHYGSIPVVSVVFTYTHIWLALWMTFYPVNFVGCCQIPGTNVGLPGWQGIIPHKAIKMATTATRLMTEKLISVKDVFNRIDPSVLATKLLPVIEELMTETTEAIALEVLPEVWTMLPTKVKTEMVNKALQDAPRVIQNMFDEMQADLDSVFDLEHMVIDKLSNDKELLNNIFIRCGNRELSFIRNSGAVMGLLFGLIQMCAWIFYAKAWLLPVVGFVVGTFTNWLALFIIFKPVEPINLGCYTVQGLFLKRQKEVAAEYGRTIATEVLTSKNIIRTLITGPTTDRLFYILNKHMQEACDQYAGVSGKLFKFTHGDQYQVFKNRVVGRLLQELPHVLSHVEEYSDEALDMENLLRTKLSALPAQDFERMLHPVFEEDEWKLVLMGGVLGVVIGVAQAVFLEGNI